MTEPTGSTPPPPSNWQQQPAQSNWQPPAQSNWQQPTVYESSLGVGNALAGIILTILGLLVALFGAVLVLGGQAFTQLGQSGQVDDPNNVLGQMSGIVSGAGIIVLVYGVLEFISGLGIFARKNWARMLGIVLSILPLLFGILGLVGAVSAPAANDLDPTGQARQGGLIFSIVLVLAYGFTIIALARGGNAFRRRVA